MGGFARGDRPDADACAAPISGRSSGVCAGFDLRDRHSHTRWSGSDRGEFRLESAPSTDLHYLAGEEVRRILQREYTEYFGADGQLIDRREWTTVSVAHGRPTPRSIYRYWWYVHASPTARVLEILLAIGSLPLLCVRRVVQAVAEVFTIWVWKLGWALLATSIGFGFGRALDGLVGTDGIAFCSGFIGLTLWAGWTVPRPIVNAQCRTPAPHPRVRRPPRPGLADTISVWLGW